MYAVTDSNKTNQALAFKEEFVGCAINPVIQGIDLTKTKVNYFKGIVPDSWKQNIPTYRVVELKEIYPNVSVKLAPRCGSIEKVIVIAPGGNTNDIKISIEGIEGLTNAGNGALLVKTSLGDITLSRPFAYQMIDHQRKKVPVEYSLDVGAKCYGFKVGAYDREETLFIDPFYGSTYLGGASNEVARGVAADSEGNIFVAGHTNSLDFPTTTGAYDLTHNSDYDIFIAKFDRNLEQLLTATYYGGNRSESYEFLRLAVDSSDNVFVAGHTFSTDIPIAGSGYDSSYGGGSNPFGDVIIAKFNSSLDELIASTYLGGSSEDTATAILIKESGDVVIAGISYSSNFPTTSGAFDTSYNGGADIFVSILSGDLRSLLNSTLLGESNEDACRDVAIDERGNIYLACRTFAAGMPTSSDAYDRDYNGGGQYGSDAYIAKFDPTLSTLLGATYFGGTDDDWGFAITLVKNDVFLSGYTRSANLPTSGTNVDSTHNGSADCFIAKFNNELSELRGCTFLGSSGWDMVYSMVFDGENSIYITGSTSSAGFPVTEGALDTSYNGGSYQYGGDAFIASFDTDLSLQRATFIGGDGIDIGYDILFHEFSVIIVGRTASTDFPTAGNAYDKSFNGADDAFVSRVDKDLSLKWLSTDVENFSASLKSKRLRIGGKTTFIGILRNRGSAAATRGKIKVYLSKKKKLFGKSILLAESNLKDINAGKKVKSKIRNIIIPDSIKSGGYYLISLIEFADSELDHNPSNNIFISSQRLTISR